MPETKSLVELEGCRFAAKWARERDVWEVVDWAMSKVVARLCRPENSRCLRRRYNHA